MSVTTDIATTKRPKAELAEQLSFTPEQMQLMKDTVAKGVTDNEFLLFMHLAKTYGLDPFAKEIWCIKYVPQGRNPADCQATIFTSRDGYLKIASRDPQMNGLQSDVVYEGDVMEKRPDGTVHHVFGNPRGAIIGAYAVVHRKDRTYPAYFYAPFKEYFSTKNPTWGKYPSAMIQKVAEAMALKRAFSISGLVTHEEIGLDITPAAAEAETSAVVLSNPSAAASEPGTGAEVVSVQPVAGGLSEADERALAGHRTRLLYARSISEVQQVWQEAGRLQKHLVQEKDAAKVRLNKASKQAEKTVAPITTEFVEQPTLGDGAPATEAQVQEIKRLTNLPVITAKEKADMLLVLRKLDEVRAGQAIFKLLNEIATREGRDADKEMRQALHTFLYNKGERLDSQEASRLAALKEDQSVHWQTLRTELMLASAHLQATATA